MTFVNSFMHSHTTSRVLFWLSLHYYKCDQNRFRDQCEAEQLNMWISCFMGDVFDVFQRSSIRGTRITWTTSSARRSHLTSSSQGMADSTSQVSQDKTREITSVMCPLRSRASPMAGSSIACPLHWEWGTSVSLHCYLIFLLFPLYRVDVYLLYCSSSLNRGEV